MNNKTIFSFIIFCCNNILINMEHQRIYQPNRSQTWYLFKEINVAEKAVGTPKKEILRKSEEYYITSVCIDPSETSLGIASCDQTVRIMDIESEQIITSIDFKNDIASMCFDHSGKKLAVLSYKPATHIFDIQRDIKRKILPCTSYSSLDHSLNHTQEISSLFFDYSNNAVGVILDRSNSTMNVINITNNTNLLSFEYREWIKLGSVSPSKKYFITASGTKQARLFNLNIGKPTCAFTLKGPVSAFAFDKREQQVAIASHEPKNITHLHKIRIFDLNTFKEVASFEHKKYISTVCFSASGKTLVFGSFDGKVYIFKKR